jgi:hypothetical protein
LDFIELDLRFAPCGFAERDDADFIFTLRMNYRNGNAREQAWRNKALLAVGEPIVFEGERDALKYQSCVNEVKAMRFEIRGTLRLRPVNSMRQCIYTAYLRQLAGSAV